MVKLYLIYYRGPSVFRQCLAYISICRFLIFVWQVSQLNNHCRINLRNKWLKALWNNNFVLLSLCLHASCKCVKVNNFLRKKMISFYFTFLDKIWQIDVQQDNFPKKGVNLVNIWVFFKFAFWKTNLRTLFELHNKEI